MLSTFQSLGGEDGARALRPQTGIYLGGRKRKVVSFLHVKRRKNETIFLKVAQVQN